MTIAITNREFQRLVMDTNPECSDMNPSYWFADPDDPDEEFGRSERAIAQGVCQRCPIKYECFKYAVENDIHYGVYGGSVPAQREAYRRKVALSPSS